MMKWHIAITLSVFVVQFASISAQLVCSEWSAWDECSTTCGGGTQQRICAGVNAGSLETETETRPCNTDDCPTVCGPWSEWSGCTVTCGPKAKRHRARVCTKLMDTCYNDSLVETEVERCENIRCPPTTDCNSTYCKWLYGTGYIADPEDCRMYYLCLRQGRGFLKFHRACTPPLYWNMDKLTCDYLPDYDTICEIVPTPEVSTVIPTPTPACPFVPSPDGDPSKYKDMITGTIRYCDLLMYFDFDLCTCLLTESEPVGDCDCLYFPFDTDVHDHSCLKAQSTMKGSVSLANGKVNNAARFNGHSRLLVSMFANWMNDYPQSGVTVSVWLKPSCHPTCNIQGIVTNAKCCDVEPSVDLGLHNMTVQGGVVTNAKNGLDSYGTETLPCNQWSHVVLIVKNNVMNLLINGQKTNPMNIAMPGQVLHRHVALAIGHAGRDIPQCQYYKGLMDELYVCRRALSAQEIIDHFNA